MPAPTDTMSPRKQAELLFEPVDIGGVTAPNRIALAPMTTCFADRDGYVTDRQIAFLAARAEGGAGLVMTEGAVVDPRGRGWDHHFCAYDDRYLPGMARLASAISRKGALAWLQLMHNGRRTVSSVTGVQPVSATARRSPGASWEVPRRLSTEEVYEVIDMFVAAIRRGAEAGFHGAELHGGHAYLINQFLSPGKNDRDDEFGGDVEGRVRFAAEIIRRAHAELGHEYPVGVRLSVVEFEPGGITLDDTLEMVRILEREGAAYIDGSAGVSTLTKELRWTIGTGEATLSEYAGRVRGELMRIPYMTVGRILRPETAERLLRDGVADIIGVGRALIADPEWPRKARTARPFMVCIGCNGCQQRSSHRQSGCPVNVLAGHEREYREESTASPRRVLVVGSGVGGLECAVACARRGHPTALLDVGLPFGGLLGLRGRVPGNEEINQALEAFAARLADAGVTRLDAPDLAAGIRAWAPELVADAMPGGMLQLPLPWRTHTLEQVLGGGVPDTALGDRVGVIGSGYAAVELGIRLAVDGRAVTVVGDRPAFARDTHPQLAYRAVERFERAGGRLRPRVAYPDLAERARGAAVVFEPYSADRDRGLDLEFDSAVLALGWAEFHRDLGAADLLEAQETYYIGDAYNPWDQRFVAERGAELGLRL
jgi:2,4-dienoyl-CoA reductase-like NADH-dependent reductase (Old Yellow Enzyme family)